MEQLLKTDILYLVLVLLFKLDDYSRVNIKKETDSSWGLYYVEHLNEVGTLEKRYISLI